jgi:hypothetical protein
MASHGLDLLLLPLGPFSASFLNVFHSNEPLSLTGVTSDLLHDNQAFPSLSRSCMTPLSLLP